MARSKRKHIRKRNIRAVKLKRKKDRQKEGLNPEQSNT
jgi:hypothetical protein